MTRISVNALEGTNVHNYNGLLDALEATLVPGGFLSVGNGTDVDLKDCAMEDLGLVRYKNDVFIFVPESIDLPNAVESSVLRVDGFFRSLSNNKLRRGITPENHSRVIHFFDGPVSAKQINDLFTQQLEILDLDYNEIYLIDTTANGKLSISSSQILTLPDELGDVQYQKQGCNLKISYQSGSVELLNYYEQQHLIGAHEALYEPLDQTASTLCETADILDEEDGSTYRLEQDNNLDELLNELNEVQWGIDGDIDIFDQMYSSPRKAVHIDSVDKKQMLSSHRGLQRSNEKQGTSEKASKYLDGVLGNIAAPGVLMPTSNKVSFSSYASDEYFIGGADDEGMPWDLGEHMLSEYQSDASYEGRREFALNYSELLSAEIISFHGEVLEVGGAGVELDIVNLEYEILQSIEVIDMTGYGGNTLNLSVTMEYQVDSRELYIYGDDSTTINLSGEGWLHEAFDKFHVYKSANTTLYIDSKINNITSRVS